MRIAEGPIAATGEQVHIFEEPTQNLLQFEQHHKYLNVRKINLRTQVNA